MKKSNLITIAICAFLLVAGGGVGAYAADQINGDTVADNTLDGGEIQNESLTGADVDNGTLTGADIRNSTLTTADIAAGTVNDALIQNGAVDGGEVRDETLTGADVKDGTVEWQDLGPNVAESLSENFAPDLLGELYLHSVGDQLHSGSTLVLLNVSSSATEAVRVTVTAPGGETVSCIADPEGFDSATCSAYVPIFVATSGTTSFLSDPVIEGADASEVVVTVGGIQVG